MSTRMLLCLLAAFMLPAAPVRAESFVLPSGEAAFRAGLTTQGLFTCVQAIPCSGSGTSSVLLGSGADTLTLSFAGVNTALTIDNVARPVSLGQFTPSGASSGFTFPTQSNPQVPILQFTLTLNHTEPVAATRTIVWTFGPGGQPDVSVFTGGVDATFPPGPNPPGFNYNDLIYTLNPFPFSLSSTAVTDLSADVGAVPEPATLALISTGLAMTAAATRKRRRKPAAATAALPAASVQLISD
jgi:PEP-CTERM motif-containing protein